MSLETRLTALSTRIATECKSLWTAVNGKANTSHTHVATTDLTATGTKSSSTYLRGDNTWAIPSPEGTALAFTAQARGSGTTFLVPNNSLRHPPTGITGMPVSVEVPGPGSVYLISYDFDVSVPAAATFVAYFYIDGVEQSSPQGVLQSPSVVIRSTVGKTLRVTGLSAGTHTFEVRVTSLSSGTPTIFDQHSVFNVEEITRPGTTPDVGVYDDTGWQYPTLSGTWQVYGNGFTAPRYRRINGIVYIEGLVRSGTGLIFVLPVGYRPAGGTQLFAVDDDQGSNARVDVDTAGNVVLNTGSTAFVSLSTIRFPSGDYTPPVVISPTGTKDTTTFLRGDNTWAVPPGSGGSNSLGVYDDTGWITPPTPFGASWTQYSAYYAVRYRRVNGIVYITGMVKGGVVGATPLWTMPVGYRPVSGVIFDQRSAGDGDAWVEVSNEGGVMVVASDSTTWVSLDISYPANDYIAPVIISPTGTKDSTTFLRGDNTWAVPPGSGGVSTATTGLDLNVNNSAPASPSVNDLWVDADEDPAPSSAPVMTQAEAEDSTHTTPRLTTGQRLAQAVAKHLPARLAPTSSSTFANYNAMVESGWYVMDSTQANAPVAATCYLEVRAYSTTYVEQVARHVTTGVTYRRTMQAGTWGAWTPTANPGAWITFTPTWTNLTVGNATNDARYTQVGKTVHAHYNLAFGSTTTVAGSGSVFHPSLPVPHTGVAVGPLWAFDSSTATWTVGTFAAGAYLITTLTGGGVARATQSSPWIWASGDLIRISITYEAV